MLKKICLSIYDSYLHHKSMPSVTPQTSKVGQYIESHQHWFCLLQKYRMGHLNASSALAGWEGIWTNHSVKIKMPWAGVAGRGGEKLKLCIDWCMLYWCGELFPSKPPLSLNMGQNCNKFCEIPLLLSCYLIMLSLYHPDSVELPCLSCCPPTQYCECHPSSDHVPWPEDLDTIKAQL